MRLCRSEYGASFFGDIRRERLRKTTIMRPSSDQVFQEHVNKVHIVIVVVG